MLPALIAAIQLLANQPPATGAQGRPPVSTNSIGIRLAALEPGSFTMGQDGPPLEDYLRQKRLADVAKATSRIDFDEKPAHMVTITRPFLMGVTEVTVGQYRHFDSGFKRNAPRSNTADDDAACGVT